MRDMNATAFPKDKVLVRKWHGKWLFRYVEARMSNELGKKDLWLHRSNMYAPKLLGTHETQVLRRTPNRKNEIKL